MFAAVEDGFFFAIYGLTAGRSKELDTSMVFGKNCLFSGIGLPKSASTVVAESFRTKTPGEVSVYASEYATLVYLFFPSAPLVIIV